MSAGRKFGVTILVVLALTAASYFLLLKPMSDKNEAKNLELKTKIDQVKDLDSKKRDLQTLEAQIAGLKQQLERQRTVVPDEKQADQFIDTLQEDAAAAGIEIRRYTAKPVATRDYYSEVPFEIDLDGPYYGVRDFFERVARRDRIINISNVQMATPARQPDAKTKKKYNYAPGESVVASCTATTFFSRTPEAAPAIPAAPVKK